MFSNRLAKGERYEVALEAWLRCLNYRICATAHDNWKCAVTAPHYALVQHATYAFPDLLVQRPDGAYRWVECKYKKRAVQDIQTGIWLTGFQTAHERVYKAVQHRTSVTVCVVFLHERENAVIVATLDELQEALVKRVDHEHMGEMTFFNYNALRKWCSAEEIWGNHERDTRARQG